MAGPRGHRLQVGSAPWIAEERSSARHIVQEEVEEFSFSARNEFDWLNEHMADIFSENQINVADVFKTPGKLRGKTPRTTRKVNPGEARIPLSDIFSATLKGAPNPFAIPHTGRNYTPKVKIPVDPHSQPSPSRITRPANVSKPTKPVSTVDSGYFGSQVQAPNAVPVADSGYHGSQSQDAMDIDDVAATQPSSPLREQAQDENIVSHTTPTKASRGHSPAHQSPDATVEMEADGTNTEYFTAKIKSTTPKPVAQESTTPAGSPTRSPEAVVAENTVSVEASAAEPFAATAQAEPDTAVVDIALDETSRSPSEKSSPIRPVRESGLNFAPLPAREPMTHRPSRLSHLDQNRKSYYGRTTGGKSLGNVWHDRADEEDEDDDVDVDEDFHLPKALAERVESDTTLAHNKTYTQRLQDQISKLGQPHPHPPRMSKSILSAQAQPIAPPSVTAAAQPPLQPEPQPSPKTFSTPGAFPLDDDEDDDEWIEPLGPPDNASSLFSPRPAMPKSRTVDVMEGTSGKETVSGDQFASPETHELRSQSKSPERMPGSGHQKSASVPSLPHPGKLDPDGSSLKKAVIVSNPTLGTVSETEAYIPGTPSKSPSRTFKDSPLKQIKNKVSSILKSSKVLLGSSAAISAEAKSALQSPSMVRLGHHAGASTFTLDQTSSHDTQPLYPDLSQQAAATETRIDIVPPRKTRASIEREKAEEKRKEKEAKEARRAAEQAEKFEKLRAQEAEKARLFKQEQERIAALEKEVAAQKEQERRAAAATPAPKSPQRPTRTSPRKAKAQQETEGHHAAEGRSDDDVEMHDIPPPASVPHSTVPRSAVKHREIKRPTRPTNQSASKVKQDPPTVFKVTVGSQHHPSNSTLASHLQDTLGPAGSETLHKSRSQISMQPKSSVSSYKTSQSSTSKRPKALELAARRKEQEDREKAERERKRVQQLEEAKRQEQRKKLEAEKKREEERKQAEAKKEASRHAKMIEMAKKTRAPPPVHRSQVTGRPDYQNDSQPARPASRLASTMKRSQEELGRPVNALLPNGAKSAQKRQLPQDAGASKKRRTSNDADDDLEMGNHPSLKGAPVRPSAGFRTVAAGTMNAQGQKSAKAQGLPPKSIFPAGYANTPSNATRDLFKTTVTNQHLTTNQNGPVRNPLDMAQVSKTAIPFAPNPNAAAQLHKTPKQPSSTTAAKSAAKSTHKASPQYQNGESIKLPEILTDDEDEYSDDEHKAMYPTWTDSPALRQALIEQEVMIPEQIFGAPAPLNMEEVFNKSKERWPKFRARTSSANWNGADGLTEEDIRKDLAARAKLRHDGAWSYEMSKEML